VEFIYIYIYIYIHTHTLFFNIIFKKIIIIKVTIISNTYLKIKVKNLNFYTIFAWISSYCYYHAQIL
jgi:hypothetical protein